MDFYEAIDKRRTIRDFENLPMPDETIKRILSAGLKAPSNDHMRDWHYIVIRDKDIAAELLKIVPKGISDEDMNRLIADWNLRDALQQECYRNAVPKQYCMLMDASIIVIPLLKQKTDILHPENLSHLNGFASIWCSIENIFLAAVAEGYASTLRIPLGDEGEWARKTLGYPEEYLMPCFLAIGKAKENAKCVEQINIDPNSRIHWEKW